MPRPLVVLAKLVVTVPVAILAIFALWGGVNQATIDYADWRPRPLGSATIVTSRAKAVRRHSGRNRYYSAWECAIIGEVGSGENRFRTELPWLAIDHQSRRPDEDCGRHLCGNIVDVGLARDGEQRVYPPEEKRPGGADRLWALAYFLLALLMLIVLFLLWRGRRSRRMTASEN